MALTLAQALADTPNFQETKIIIDEFRKNSHIFEKMPFVSLGQLNGSGSAWIYQYSRVKTRVGANTRAINAEFTPAVADRETKTAQLKILGGSFQIDRAIAGTSYVMDNIAFQVEQLQIGAMAKFNDLVINGDSGSDANAFDGLNVALTSGTTEINTGKTTDLSTTANIDSNYKGFWDDFSDFMATLDGVPSVLYMNSKAKSKLTSVSRRTGDAGVIQYKVQDAEITIPTVFGIPIVDLGDKPASSNPIVPIATRTVNSVSTTGLTDIYAVRYGEDGFHGILPSSKGQAIKLYLPDLKAPTAVKTGELEMIVGIALKATKAAGVFRNVKVQ